MRRSSALAGPLPRSAARAGSGEKLIVWPLGFGMAIRPVIFVPRGFHGSEPVARRAMLAHERVHHRQQRAVGLARFCLGYLLNPSFRWRVERAGYRREFLIYLRAGRRPDPAGYARLLCGPFYAWMVRPSAALAWCEKTIIRLAARP